MFTDRWCGCVFKSLDGILRRRKAFFEMCIQKRGAALHLNTTLELDLHIPRSGTGFLHRLADCVSEIMENGEHEHLSKISIEECDEYSIHWCC